MNPIIPGFAPDPSMIRVRDTYYAVNSSFHIFPCLPVFASKDLIDWTHIGNAINNRAYLTGKLSLRESSTRISPPGEWSEPGCFTSGLWAPTIRFHNNTFYVICTNVLLHDKPSDERRHNFVVSTSDPYSDDWSKPVLIDVNGQDPGLVWDDEGRAYVHFSAVADPPSQWTSINQVEVSLQTGERIGEEKVLWKGTGGIYLEGPHVCRKDGWWYLMASEGGCFPDHMITVARSRDLWGPYESAESNPVLPPAKEGAYVAHTGHGDFVEGTDGQWWSIALGVRKDAKGRYNMGRESFLTPMSWPEGGWPKLEPVEINPEQMLVRSQRRRPGKDEERGVAVAKWDARFCYIRDVDLSKHKILREGNAIYLTPDTGFFSDVYKPTSFAGIRQRKHNGRASVVMTTQDHETGIYHRTGRAGLAVYKDEHRYLCVYVDFVSSEIVYEAINNAKKVTIKQREKIAAGVRIVIFCVEYTEASYGFSYTAEGNTRVFKTFDTIGLTGFDFVGPIIGVFAASEEPTFPVLFEALDVDRNVS